MPTPLVPTIDRIMNQVREAGFANPTKYTIQIYRNSILLNNSGIPKVTVGGTGAQDITINCDMVSIPGLNLISMDRRYYGPTRKLPYHQNYSEFSMSFYCSEDHRERLYFEDWMNDIRNPTTNNMSFYDDYVATIVVSNFDNSMRLSLKSYLAEAWPVSVSPIDLGYGNMSTPEKIMVSFAYVSYNKLERAPR